MQLLGDESELKYLRIEGSKPISHWFYHELMVYRALPAGLKRINRHENSILTDRFGIEDFPLVVLFGHARPNEIGR